MLRYRAVAVAVAVAAQRTSLVPRAKGPAVLAVVLRDGSGGATAKDCR